MTNINKAIAENTKTFIIFAWPLGILLACLASILMLIDLKFSLELLSE